MAKALYFLGFIFVFGYPCALSNQDKNQENWIHLERYLLRNLKEYAEKLREKISVINSSVNDYLEEIEEAKEDPELYLANPLNSFRLIRHMHQDWVSWQIYMEKTVGEKEAANIERVLEKLPHEWDVQGAAQDVRIVTKFYNYDPAELLAQDERNSPIHLSPLDCYHLGLERYKEKDYKAAAKWLGVAAKNFSQSEYSDLYAQIGAPRWKMYRDYARALDKLNRGEKYQAYEEATKLSPHNVHLMQEIGEMELLTLRDPLDPISDDVDRPTDVQKMCRGKKTPNENSLVCEYNNFVTPFLQLAKMRLEEVFSEPYTIMYPQSVYESEIEHMVNVYSRCPHNVLFQLEEGVAVCSVSNGYSSVTKGLRERVLDMTGYSRDSDNFYVVAYDTLQPIEIFKQLRAYSKFSDVRFTEIEATVLIFLNDVPLGGAIILPDYEFDMFVQPKKGNVLVVFDEKELRTTICPNIAGHGLAMFKFVYQDQ